MKSSRVLAAGRGAVAELARQVEPVRRRALARHFLLRRAARLARAGRQDDARDDRFGHAQVVVQPVLDRRPHRRVHRGEDLGVVQPILGLALELRLGDEDAEHADEALADVVGRQRDALGRQVVRLDEVAHRLADARAQAVLVRAAGAGRDAVDVAADLLVGRLGPLHRQVDAEAVVLREHERRLVDRSACSRREQLLQVGLDAVGVLERLARLRRLVLEDDLHALVEVARHLETLADDGRVELDLREDRRVGPEEHRRARCRGPRRASSPRPAGCPA